METTTEKNTATFTHLSSLTQYFIPFGNYIFPILIWSSQKGKSEFVDHNGKQVLNLFFVEARKMIELVQASIQPYVLLEKLIKKRQL